jgi:hypothetical protein
MKNLQNLLFLLLLIWTLSGCSALYYAPTGHNVPLLREKNELRVNAALSATETLAGGEVQISFAPANHFGIMANGTFLQHSKKQYGHLTETGLGYFKAFPKGLSLEAYGGLGRAKVINDIRNEPSLLKFTKSFVQPAIGYRIRKPLFWPFFKNLKHDFEIALSPKTSYIYYSEPFIEARYAVDANGNLVETITAQRQFWAFEPALTLRSGWEYVLLQVQYGLSFQDIPGSDHANITIGLSFNLAPRFDATP